VILVEISDLVKHMPLKPQATMWPILSYIFQLLECVPYLEKMVPAAIFLVPGSWIIKHSGEIILKYSYYNIATTQNFMSFCHSNPENPAQLIYILSVLVINQIVTSNLTLLVKVASYQNYKACEFNNKDF